MDTVDQIIQELENNKPVTTLATHSRLVQSQDGTKREHGYLTDNTTSAAEFEAYSQRVDSLFGDKPAYQGLRKEMPVHRQMLWLRLNGHNVKETAAITGYSPQQVSVVCKQPWFREAFIKLSTQMGKDSVESFLNGEIIPTLERLVHLRDNAESDAVRKSACDSILDRIRGKPVARVETKHSGSIDTTVYDGERLRDELQRNAEILRSRGINSGSN
jgi:hypothetical protein